MLRAAPRMACSRESSASVSVSSSIESASASSLAVSSLRGRAAICSLNFIEASSISRLAAIPTLVLPRAGTRAVASAGSRDVDGAPASEVPGFGAYVSSAQVTTVIDGKVSV